MKVAMINPPGNTVAQGISRGGSPQIIIYEITRRLALSCDITVYERMSPFQTEYEGVHYRPVPIALDQKILRFLRLSSRIRHVKRPYFSSQCFFLVYALQIANDLRKQQCDIIHIHDHTHFAPIIRFFNPDIKIVLHTHNQWLTQLDQAMIQRRLRHVNLIIGCSNFITEKIRRCFPHMANCCQTIYNGVDVQHFAPESNDNVKQDDRVKRLLYVGRVSPEKGVHILLAAFQKVVERHPQVQLDIVGRIDPLPQEMFIDLSDDPKVADLASFYTGDYLSHLQNKLSSSAMSNISFLGPVPHSQLINHYRNADVSILPSVIDETFGMAPAESMATCVPVVATQVGGLVETVEHEKTGLLIEPGNPSALATAILYLLENEDLRKSMGTAGRQRVLERFSWEQITQDLLCQYESLMQAT